MVDFILLVGRLLLVALLYLFLFFAVKTGIGLVKGQNKKAKAWFVIVRTGPKALKGIKLTVAGPLVIGRSPGADIVIPTDYVSSKHARFVPAQDRLIIEDLGSTNGTMLNGRPVHGSADCSAGDTVRIGNIDIEIGRS